MKILLRDFFYRLSKPLARIEYLKCLTLTAVLLFSQFANVMALPTGELSAEITVSGTVKDETGAAMPGVNILIKGTTSGTSSDGTGSYKISVPDGNAVLVFSFIGYTSKEVPVGNQATIDVTMDPDVNQLSEIVVIGYGTQKKSSVTGAVASVSAKEVSALPVPSVASALQGRVPGVIVTNNGGPGSAAIVRIRGVGSITSSSDPLYVVDGFPAFGNLNNLDTKDIESVEVLKDAAATAIYGSRGANGVVLITTKRGSKDNKIHVDIEAFAGSQSAWNTLDLLKRDDYIAYGTALLTNAGSSAPTRFSNLNTPIYSGATQTFAQTETDWQDEMFRTGGISQVQASISSSSDNSKLYASFGKFQQDGIMIGTSFERYNARINYQTKIGKRITFGESLTIANSTTRNQLESGGRTMIMHMIRGVPYIPVHNPTALGGFAGTTNADGSDPENPVRLATMDKRVNYNFNLLANAFIEAEIISGLRYKFTFGANYSVGRNTSDDPIFNDGGFQGRTTHNIGDARGNSYSPYYSNQLTYDKALGDHTINATVVGERQDGRGTNLSVSGQQASNDLSQLVGSTNQTISDGSRSETVLLSYLGRVNYDFKGKYLLSASMRRDGYSGFAPGNKWGNFPGASVGWKLTEESFMSGLNVVNDLKIRASYGSVGANGVDPYGYVSFIGSQTTFPFNNVNTQGTYFDQLPNALRSWEITKASNIGFDLGMFENKFTFSAEYFNRQTDELLLNVSPAPSLGYAQGTIFNVGGMRNYGYEFTAGYSKVKGDFSFNASANMAVVRNEVTALVDQIYFSGGNQDYGGGQITRTIQGSPIQQFYLYETDGIYQSVSEIIGTDSRPASANSNLPLNADGTVNLAVYNDPLNKDKYTRPGDIRFNGQKELGTFLPKFTYGTNLSASFKGFDATMFIQGVQGNKIYNGTKVLEQGMLRLFGAGTAVKDAWTPTNTNTDVPRAINGDPNQNSRPSDRFLEDGSYLRIKNFSIGYTVPSSLMNFAKSSVMRVRIYFSAQNLLTLTKYTGYDPEVGSRNYGLLTNGIDYGQFPQARTFMGGIQVGF